MERSDLIQQLIDRIDKQVNKFDSGAVDPWKDPDAVASFLKAKVVESIRQKMNGDNISETDLASRTGLRQQQIHSMLNEKGNFSLKTLARIAVALGMSVSVDFTKGRGRN